MGLLSIRRLMEGKPKAEPDSTGCDERIREILSLVVRQSPGLDDESRRSLCEQLDDWREGTQPTDENALLLHVGEEWMAFNEKAETQRQALTDVISLLAEAAGQADQANSQFYKQVLKSVRSIEHAGQLADINALRASLNEHLSGLRGAVKTQQKESAMIRQSIETNLAEVRDRVVVFSRLVQSEPLSLLPTARHGKQLIGELIERQRPFVTVAIRLEGLETVRHRFDDAVANRVFGRFRTRVRTSLPTAVHLYHWHDRLLVAVSDEVDSSAMREGLEELSRGIRESPIKDEDMTRTIALSAAFETKTYQRGTSLEELTADLEQSVAAR